MPKNKPRKNKGRGIRNGGVSDLLKVDSAPHSQEEDTLSEGSSIPPGGGEYANEENGSDGQIETAPIDVVEEKLKESIDGLTERSKRIRLACLSEIRKCLLTHWMVDFLENYKETLLDGVEKCLKKGDGIEQALAAEVLAILSIHLGGSGDEEMLYTQLKPYLTTLILDTSSSIRARAKCAQVLGILAYIAVDDIDEIVSCMSAFDTLFAGSFLKGDKSVPSVSTDVSELHLNALSSWSLLVSVTPWEKVKVFAEKRLPRLPELLTSNNLELRITAGETIALFYEILRSEDAGYMMRRLLNEKELVFDLKELATDSSKHRAKKDKKQQRSSFRDIVRMVETGEVPEHHMKFGNDTVYIDSWTLMRQYSAIRDILTTGLNRHIKENLFIRSIFNLGPPQLSGQEAAKSSRFERHLFNQAVFKARSQARGKLRDKRTAFRT